jgi:hypothetical protein
VQLSRAGCSPRRVRRVRRLSPSGEHRLDRCAGGLVPVGPQAPVGIEGGDRFDAAEAALDAARKERAQARPARYAARQAHERASTAVNRLQRRVRELSERLDRAAELASDGGGGIVQDAAASSS